MPQRPGCAEPCAEARKPELLSGFVSFRGDRRDKRQSSTVWRGSLNSIRSQRGGKAVRWVKNSHSVGTQNSQQGPDCNEFMVCAC